MQRRLHPGRDAADRAVADRVLQRRRIGRIGIFPKRKHTGLPFARAARPGRIDPELAATLADRNGEVADGAAKLVDDGLERARDARAHCLGVPPLVCTGAGCGASDDLAVGPRDCDRSALYPYEQATDGGADDRSGNLADRAAQRSADRCAQRLAAHCPDCAADIFFATAFAHNAGDRGAEPGGLKRLAQMLVEGLVSEDLFQLVCQRPKPLANALVAAELPCQRLKAADRIAGRSPNVAELAGQHRLNDLRDGTAGRISDRVADGLRISKHCAVESVGLQLRHLLPQIDVPLRRCNSGRKPGCIAAAIVGRLAGSVCCLRPLDQPNKAAVATCELIELSRGLPGEGGKSLHKLCLLGGKSLRLAGRRVGRALRLARCGVGKPPGLPLPFLAGALCPLGKGLQRFAVKRLELPAAIRIETEQLVATRAGKRALGLSAGNSLSGGSALGFKPRRKQRRSAAQHPRD